MMIAISIFAIGVLIALHELGHFVAARLMGMKVLRFSVGFLHPLVSWVSKKTGIAYQIGVLPLGGFVQIKGMNPFEEGAYEDQQSYSAKPVWRRAVVTVAGPLANFFVAWGLFFGLYLAGVPEPTHESRIGFVSPGEPAEKAGLTAGDQITRFNGQPVQSWEELASKLHANPGKAVSLTIVRGNQHFQTSVTPKNQGGIGLIGIGPPTRIVRLPAYIAAKAATMRCGQLVAGSLTGLVQWISGTNSEVHAVGPVGIVKMTAQSLSSGWRDFFALVGYLSVMLCLFNLMPFPALDGGRGIFLLFEGISRHRVNRTVDATVNTIGFALLLGLLLLVSANEIFGLF